MGDVLVLSLTNANVTLNATQAQSCTLRLTGTLTGNVIITNPNIGFYYVENLTTGAFTVTLTNGVVGVTIDQGGRYPVFADATYGVRIMLPSSSSPLTPDLTNVELSITTTYTIAIADNHKTINCTGGAFYTVGLAATSGYPSAFAVAIVNSDSRGKRISPSGVTSFILWPGQTTTVRSTSSGWRCDPSQTGERWRPAAGAGTLYVDPVLGADTNDGLATGIGGALLTIQQAVNYHYWYKDFGTAGSLIVQLAPGTYSVGAGVNVTAPTALGANQVQIQGDINNPLAYDIVCNVANGSCFFVRDQGILTLSGVSMRAVVGGAVLISVSQGSTVDVENCNFGAAATHMGAATWSSINVLGNYTVSGDVGSHIVCSQNAYVNYTGFTCSISTPISLASFWMVVNTSGSVLGGTFSFINAGTVSGGAQYAVDLNGTLQLGSPASVYPGNPAGNLVVRGGQVL